MKHETRREKEIKTLKIDNLLKTATAGQRAQFMQSILVNLSVAKLNQAIRDLKRLEEYNKRK